MYHSGAAGSQAGRYAIPGVTVPVLSCQGCLMRPLSSAAWVSAGMTPVMPTCIRAKHRTGASSSSRHEARTNRALGGITSGQLSRRRDRVGRTHLAVPGRAAPAREIRRDGGSLGLGGGGRPGRRQRRAHRPVPGALASGSRPGTSSAALAAAGISQAVLTPLAVAKRRLGQRMASRALQGDGAHSGIGAATSLLALVSLALSAALGWWWADRVAALIVAAVAAAEAWHTAPKPQSPAQA
jgi:hypothetical protein